MAFVHHALTTSCFGSSQAALGCGRRLVRCLSSAATELAPVSSSSSSGKVYELRTYDVKPKRMTEFLEMTAREIHLRLAVAKCLGYWVCQFGAINQTVHLWEFDSYAHRAESRVAMMQNSELVERFLTPVMQMVNKQHSQMLGLLPGTSLNCPAKPGGAYELVSLCMKSSPTVWLPKAAEMVPACDSIVHTAGASVVAAFKTEFGPLNECIFLLHYPSFDMHRQYAEAIMSNDECFKLVSKFANMVAEGHNKGMTPFPGLQTAMQ